MEKYLFSNAAIDQIMEECSKSGSNLETGGILIGPKQHRRIVTDVIPSSAYAERQACTYYQSEEDVRVLNQKLREFQDIGYDFKGYWHRHPSGMYQLSSGDLNTCAEVLVSPSYMIQNNLLLMCIVTESEGKLTVFAYNTSLNNNHVVVQPLSFKVMPKNIIQEVLKFLTNEPITKGDEDYESFHSGQNFRSNEKQERIYSVRVSAGRVSFRNLSRYETGDDGNRTVRLESRRC